MNYMKILIAGVGKVGSILAKKLSSEGYDLILIDTNKQVLEGCMEQYDVISVCGNCAVKSTLLDADVRDANVLIAMTHSDELNLLCCMTAHRLNPNIHTIARIRNPEYMDQVYEMRDEFALSLIVNPEKQAAEEIERLLKYPGFLKIDTFSKGRAEIIELRVDKDSKLDNIMLSNIHSVIKCKVLVCLVMRDGKPLMPNGDFILQANDRIYVSAPSENLTTLIDNLGIQRKKTKHAMLCGASRTSYYLAQQLLKNSVDVKIIDINKERCVALSELLPQADIIHGDASDCNLLLSEDISKYDAVVSTTGMDEINMVISLYSTAHNVPKVVTKLGRVGDYGILESLDIGSIVSPKELCCNNIVRYIRAINNRTGAASSVHFIADGNAEAIEFRVKDDTLYCGVPLKDINLRKHLLIACIIRNRRIIIPDGESSYEKGDTIIIVNSMENQIFQLNDIFDRE